MGTRRLRRSANQFCVLSFRDGAVRSAVYAPPPSCSLSPVTTFGDAAGEPSADNGGAFLRLFQMAIRDFRPEILLTYGGYRLASPMLHFARNEGVRNVFWLCNFAYQDAALFEAVDCIIVPSAFSSEYYRRTLGVATVAIPSPLAWDRVRCDRSRQSRYVTFVNPQREKGVFLYARIAEQLFRRRPEIPLLVVEGRCATQWLAKTGLDLSGLRNLNVMDNTPDPRDFYRVTDVLLMPSLWRESFGRVAAEAMINGIPVLASRRGSLPELLGDAGFLFDVDDRYTPESRTPPSAEEVQPWVETIIRLWDNRRLYREASQRCRARNAWRPEVIAAAHIRVLEDLLTCRV